MKPSRSFSRSYGGDGGLVVADGISQRRWWLMVLGGDGGSVVADGVGRKIGTSPDALSSNVVGLLKMNQT